MASIGVELQKVLDLAPEYTRVPSPSLRERDEACRRLQDELRKVLAAMPAASPKMLLDACLLYGIPGMGVERHQRYAK